METLQKQMEDKLGRSSHHGFITFIFTRIITPAFSFRYHSFGLGRVLFIRRLVQVIKIISTYLFIRLEAVI